MPGMVVQCEFDVKKCKNANFFAVVVQCDRMQILIPFSHCIRISHFFAFFSHFFFLHFLLLFGALSVKHEKKRAKNSMQMQNAMQKRAMQCNGLGQKCKCECEKLFTLPALVYACDIRLFDKKYCFLFFEFPISNLDVAHGHLNDSVSRSPKQFKWISKKKWTKAKPRSVCYDDCE